ncbi:MULTISPECIES: hypothetical protein [unclassified Methylobacterium]|uniref:hypothetical protein n=1 Tax=unclassified Methylobacterium TaxID=2615210 RepID=UPI001FEFDBE8|nr:MULTISPECIES: hypothetical protein [unclassified Methylobacterium]
MTDVSTDPTVVMSLVRLSGSQFHGLDIGMSLSISAGILVQFEQASVFLADKEGASNAPSQCLLDFDTLRLR